MTFESLGDLWGPALRSFLLLSAQLLQSHRCTSAGPHGTQAMISGQMASINMVRMWTERKMRCVRGQEVSPRDGEERWRTKPLYWLLFIAVIKHTTAKRDLWKNLSRLK